MEHNLYTEGVYLPTSDAACLSTLLPPVPLSSAGPFVMAVAKSQVAGLQALQRAHKRLAEQASGTSSCSVQIGYEPSAVSQVL
jgi:hypothetical protein